MLEGEGRVTSLTSWASRATLDEPVGQDRSGGEGRVLVYLASKNELELEAAASLAQKQKLHACKPCSHLF